MSAKVLWARLAMLFAVGLAPASTVWAQTGATSSVSWVRCEYALGDAPVSRPGVAFPDGDLFRPLLADPKEPRNSFAYRQVRFLETPTPVVAAAQTMNVGTVSVGGIVGLWAHKLSVCRGIQISLMGGVFSEFNLDAPSRDLINTDFVVGVQAAFRKGGISGRIRVYHQSSHLGDEVVKENPSAGDLNFGFQAVDGLVSLDRTRWRAYAGGGYLMFMNGGGGSGLIHGGAEYRAFHRLSGMFRPVAGLDVTSVQARSWGLTTAASAGLEWTSPEASRRLRATVLFVDGYTPFGQFMIRQKSRAIGVQLQIEF